MTALSLDRIAPRAWWRRCLFLGLVGATGATGLWLMGRSLATNGITTVEVGVLAIFAIAFAWIAVSFWAAVAGAILLVLRRHPLTLTRWSRADCAAEAETVLHGRTAILMPVHNEDARRVFAGLLATRESLQRTGQAACFDFFVLSDTRDPEIARAEEAMWRHVCATVRDASRIFYRRRADNVGRKAGNIADWVDRHGAGYEFMVVLDADSVLSGATLVTLAARMEANPRTGIIQTLSFAVGRNTLFARSLQFAGRLYGPMLAWGHSFWQAGEANYYGHNAIIRIAAFAANCRLPHLPGTPPLGGEILSHDFVEAALMRRGGFFVWLCPELRGSYEELPSNLVDYAARDRRWTQGNLQHARLLALPGLHWMSRLHLALGVLAFVVSPLWLLLLLLSSAAVLQQHIAGPYYFPFARSLFPTWPEYAPGETFALLMLTAALLFLPRVLSVIGVLVSQRKRRRFGGTRSLVAGGLLELALSVLHAPVMMLFHSAFIARILAGASVGWSAQPRDDRGLGWNEGLRRHAGHTLIGLVWAAAIGWIVPDFLWWLAPVVLGLLLSVPACVLGSRSDLGIRARAAGLLLTPDEVSPPPELAALERQLRTLPAHPAATEAQPAPFALAAA